MKDWLTNADSIKITGEKITVELENPVNGSIHQIHLHEGESLEAIAKTTEEERKWHLENNKPREEDM